MDSEHRKRPRRPQEGRPDAAADWREFVRERDEAERRRLESGLRLVEAQLEDGGWASTDRYGREKRRPLTTYRRSELRREKRQIESDLSRLHGRAGQSTPYRT